MARGYLVSGLLLWTVGALVGCGSDDDGGSGAGSGGTGSGGSGSGGSSKSTAADVTATCEPETAKLTYDGGAEQAYDISGWPAPFGYPTPGTFHLFDPLGDGYYDMVISPVLDDALVAAAEPFPLYFKEGAPGEIVKGFVAQATDETLGPIHCVAEGSGSTIARKGDDLLFDLKNADVIAACGDNPVEGQINLCFQFGGCDDFDGGTVDGVPWTLQPSEWIGAGGKWTATLAGGGTLRASTTNSVTGPAYWALIMTTSASPYGEQVFCASGGSVEETPGDFGYTILHFTSLGKITCGAGSGKVQGCLDGSEPAP